MIGINCVTRSLNGHFKLLFLGRSGQVLKIISKILLEVFRFFFFLLVKCFPLSPICETGSWSLVCLSVERHNSVPKRYLKASTEHKQCQKKQESAYSNKQHRLQQRCGTARLVFRTLTGSAPTTNTLNINVG